MPLSTVTEELRQLGTRKKKPIRSRRTPDQGMPIAQNRRSESEVCRQPADDMHVVGTTKIKKIAKSKPAEHDLLLANQRPARGADCLVAGGRSTTPDTRACASCSATKSSPSDAWGPAGPPRCGPRGQEGPRRTRQWPGRGDNHKDRDRAPPGDGTERPTTVTVESDTDSLPCPAPDQGQALGHIKQARTRGDRTKWPTEQACSAGVGEGRTGTVTLGFVGIRQKR